MKREMDNSQPGTERGDLEEALATLPDRVADALLIWRTATAAKKKLVGDLFVKMKSVHSDMSSTEIKTRISASKELFEAEMKEVSAEAEHTRLNERLMAAKKLASLRTAF
jgi:hypothetical protein